MTNLNSQKESGTIDIQSGKAQFWRQIGKLGNDAAFDVFRFRCYPNVAQYLLSINTFENQRRISSNTVEHFCDILTAGNFFFGSTIRLAQDSNGRWTLTDGQHRLAAIVASGIAAEMVAVFSNDEIHHEYASVDSGGRNRSLQDAIRAYGFEFTKTMPQRDQRRFEPACKIIRDDFVLVNKRADSLAVGLFAEGFSAEMSALIKWANKTKTFAHGPHGSMKVPMLAVALVTVRHAPTIAEEFWRKAFENDGLGRYDVRRHMSDLILSPYGGGYSKQQEFLDRTTYLWNLFVLGQREMKTWRGLPDSPQCILRTPYPKRLNCNENTL